MAKLARFTFLLDPDLKDAFEKLCAQQDITSSQMMRSLLKRHLAEHQPAMLVPLKKRKQGLVPSDR